mmetsp:Transcript_21124/g.41259  ORF Transcript_21124/g.41259 Transcript_21124/m.41259 type:complete len:462 (-) Transcript_21124:24-1409(-)
MEGQRSSLLRRPGAPRALQIGRLDPLPAVSIPRQTLLATYEGPRRKRLKQAGAPGGAGADAAGIGLPTSPSAVAAPSITLDAPAAATAANASAAAADIPAASPAVATLPRMTGTEGWEIANTPQRGRVPQELCQLQTPIKEMASERSAPSQPSAPSAGRVRTEASVSDCWELRNVLGKTHFSEVRLCVRRGSCEEQALKVISKRTLARSRGKNPSKSLTDEAELLRSLQHQAIVRFEDWFETEDSLYLVMEFVPGGDLFSSVVREGIFQEDQAQRLFREVCEAVAYLHTEGVVHRDLKLENILMTEQDRCTTHIKVTDFGIARHAGRSRDCKTFCGSLNYTAPEVVRLRPVNLDKAYRKDSGLVSMDTSMELLEHRSGYGKPADLWSLGVVLYIMLCASPPFEGESQESLCCQIQAGRWDFDVDEWDLVSADAKALIGSLMMVNPRERLTIEGALSHAWLL